VGDADRFLSRQGFVHRTFISLFLAEIHAALEDLVACFTFNILQTEIIVLQECLVGTYDFEVTGKYDDCFLVACAKYLGECLWTYHFAAAIPES
jgi:hypothetical protein